MAIRHCVILECRHLANGFDNVPSVPVREELDDVIHIEEVRKAVNQMKCNKASGGDGIPAEVYKHMEGPP